MEEYRKLFTELRKKVESINDDLSDWSLNYFNEANKKRYINDMRLIRDYYDSGEILEIGAAPYHLTFLLERTGYKVTGIDINPDRYFNFIEETDLNIIKCDIESEPLPFEDNSFKFIIFNEIFEHLRINPIKTLKEINRVLHPEGKFLISTPNLYGIRNLINFLLGKGFDNPYEEFLKIETIQHMGHVRIYSVNQIRKFLLKTGFHPIKTDIKTFDKYKGLWKLFIVLPWLFPFFNSIQIHICKKTTQNALYQIQNKD
ncbi:MAG: methyltransferase domain-containing protein [Bacteroidales bacterium]|nr:methyltransferase domain-containing protein [Bacteroidales bacterium]